MITQELDERLQALKAQQEGLERVCLLPLHMLRSRARIVAARA